MNNTKMNLEETYFKADVNDTFAELCQSWLTKKKIKLKNSSYAKYVDLFERHIMTELGTIKISEINLLAVEQGIANIYYSGAQSTFSLSTMKSILYLINAVLSYGSHLGYFEIGRAVFEFPRTGCREIMALNVHQESKLLSDLFSRRDSNSLGIMISLFTGMRLGEVCSLQRKNIDFEKAVIYVKSTVQRLRSIRDENTGKTELMVTVPKSRDSEREIPIPAFLQYYIKDFGIDVTDKESYILGKGNTPYEPRTLQYGFHSALKRCGIDRMNYHCLRHTFASNCIKLGFDVKTLSELLGHTSVNFTLNRYVHSDIEQKRIQMSLFDSSYQKICKIS